MSDVLHKRKARSNGKRGPRTVCGKAGESTHLWVNVTCPSCKARKK